MIKITTEDFISKIKDNNFKYEVIGEYTGTHHRIKIRCKMCGFEWEPYAHAVSKGTSKCPNCQSKSGKKNMLSNDAFINIVHMCNKNIEPLEEYQGCYKSIKMRCTKHDYEFECKPKTFTIKHALGCRLCMHEAGVFGGKRMSEYEIQTILSKSRYIYQYSERINHTLYIYFICPDHKDKGIQKVLWSGISQNRCCCKYCRGIDKTTEELQKQIDSIHGNIKILGKYQNPRTPIEVICNIDGTIWHPRPYNLLSGFGCPTCASSKAEKAIANILNKWGYNYEREYYYEDLKDIDYLRFDFYLKDFNTLIEYDGEFHYKPIIDGKRTTMEMAENQLIIQQKHDQMKNDYCSEHNINLIRIPYWKREELEETLFDALVKYNIIIKAS